MTIESLLALGFGDGGFLAGRVLTELGDDAASLGDDAIELIFDVGDDLAEAGADLGDEAVGGLGKLTTSSLPTDRAKRILDGLCPGTFAQISHSRPPGLACPLYQVCDLELFERVLANIKQWDEDTLLRFKVLSNNLVVSEQRLAGWLTKYADEPEKITTLVRALGDPDPKIVQRATDVISRYGDEATDLVARYGSDGRDALAKMGTLHGEELISLAKTYGDVPGESEVFESFVGQLGRMEIVAGIPQLPLPPLVKPSQAYELSKTAQGLAGLPPLNTTIGGRFADTFDDIAVRAAAWREANDMIIHYMDVPLEDFVRDLPQSASDYAKLGKKQREEVATFLAQIEVAPKHDILWPQVKVSSGKPEVDAFIPKTEWAQLTIQQQIEIRTKIADIFGIPYDVSTQEGIDALTESIDMYQDIRVADWMQDIARQKGISLPNPGTTFPNGAVRFYHSGEILHPPITGVQPPGP